MVKLVAILSLIAFGVNTTFAQTEEKYNMYQIKYSTNSQEHSIFAISNDTLFVFVDMKDFSATDSIFKEQTKKELKKNFGKTHTLKFIERWSILYGGPFVCNIFGSQDTIQFIVTKEPPKQKRKYLYRFEKCLLKDSLVKIRNIRVGDDKHKVFNKLGIDTNTFRNINCVIFLDINNTRFKPSPNDNDEIKIGDYEQYIVENVLYSPHNAVYIFSFISEKLDLIFISFLENSWYYRNRNNFNDYSIEISSSTF